MSPSPPPNEPKTPGRRFALALGAGFAIVIVIIGVLMVQTWMRIGLGSVSIHGYIAIAAGTVLTVLVAIGLMGLMFHSSRRGYDDDQTGPPYP